MARIKRGTMHVKRRKNLLAKTKGYKWRRKNTVRQARTAVIKAGVEAYRGRKLKKRDMRSLWIIRLNASLRENGLTYSRFIPMLKNAKVILDRKTLAYLAAEYPAVFKKLLAEVQK